MLNLLLVGYGKMGNIHARSVMESKNAKLCGIVDPNFNDGSSCQPARTFAVISNFLFEASGL